MLDRENRGPVAIKASPVHRRSEVEMSEGDAVFDAAPELAATTPRGSGSVAALRRAKEQQPLMSGWQKKKKPNKKTHKAEVSEPDALFTYRPSPGC